MSNSTLVIIPGWGGNHDTWAKFIQKAKPHFTDVICFDLPGFGGVECPSEVWGVEEYTDHVKEKLATISPPMRGSWRGSGVASDIVLLGHSFGGQVAAYLVANNPKVCSKLILSAAAMFRPKKPLRRTFFWIVAKLGKILFKLPVIEHAGLWAKKILYKTADSPDYSQTSGMQREIYKKIICQDLTDELPKISVPTLIIWGTLDKYLPLKDGKKAHKLIPHSRLEIISDAPHGMHIYHTEKFLQIIRNFVE